MIESLQRISRVEQVIREVRRNGSAKPVFPQAGVLEGNEPVTTIVIARTPEEVRGISVFAGSGSGNFAPEVIAILPKVRGGTYSPYEY